MTEPILIGLTILVSIAVVMIGLYVALGPAGAVWPGVLLMAMAAGLMVVGAALALERWGPRTVSRRIYGRVGSYSAPRLSVAGRFDRADRRVGPRRPAVPSLQQQPPPAKRA